MKKLLVGTLFAGFVLLTSCSNNQSQQETVAPQPQESQQVTEEKPSTPLDLSEFKDIKLLAPDSTNKATLMDALKTRRSSREYSDKQLSLEDLSTLLWVADGVNHIDGRRTAPSAYAVYPMKIYVVLSNGIYCYDADNDNLIAVAKGDYRELTGSQEFAHSTPVNLMYVADVKKYHPKFSFLPDEVLSKYAVADAGFRAENVYLYCAISGMKTVVRATDIREKELQEVLKVDNKHEIFLIQSVGY